jgi:hypothetical protein
MVIKSGEVYILMETQTTYEIQRTRLPLLDEKIKKTTLYNEIVETVPLSLRGTNGFHNFELPALLHFARRLYTNTCQYMAHSKHLRNGQHNLTKFIHTHC